MSIATLDDMKALYAGFDLCDPTTSVSMTINGPAPTILAMFFNAAIDDQLARFEADHGRPAAERRGGRDPGRHPAPGPGDRPGRHPEGGPGPEHLHLLDRVLAAGDGRHAGVVHRQPGAQLLLGVRSPATTSPRPGPTRSPSSPSPWPTDSPTSRPTWLGAWTSTTSPQLLVLLLERHGPRVHRHRPGRPADLGRRHARPLRRQRPLAEAQVPRPDVGPIPPRPGDGVQRHPHHPPGAVRHLRQRQQPPHQRLRRGGRPPRPPSRSAGPWPSR